MGQTNSYDMSGIIVQIAIFGNTFLPTFWSHKLEKFEYFPAISTHGKFKILTYGHFCPSKLKYSFVEECKMRGCHLANEQVKVDSTKIM